MIARLLNLEQHRRNTVEGQKSPAYKNMSLNDILKTNEQAYLI